MPVPFLFVALQEQDDDPVGEESDGDADDARADKHGPDQFQRLPGEEPGEREFVQFKGSRKMVRMGNDPIAEPIFKKDDDRPDGGEDVVEGDGDDGGELAATAKPGGADGEERLEAGEGSEAPEESNGHTAGYGVGSVAQFA